MRKARHTRPTGFVPDSRVAGALVARPCKLAVICGAEKATARGFEPLRADPNGFLVHHLNHSVTLSMSFVLLGMTNVEILQKQGKCGK